MIGRRDALLVTLLALAGCAPAENYQGRQLSCAGGVLGGAAAGGILGNQVGGGTGKDLATALGAGLGALAGTQNPNCLAPAQAQAQAQIIGYDRYGNAIYSAPPTQARATIIGYDRYGRPIYGR
ncbi:MAG: glycine zipper 2TM domain-containing protein [Amaricoccus sp.]